MGRRNVFCFILTRTRPLRLNEMLAEIENCLNEDEEPSSIVLTLPPATVDTDCDSGDELCDNANHLNQNQLEVFAEIEFDVIADILVHF